MSPGLGDSRQHCPPHTHTPALCPALQEDSAAAHLQDRAPRDVEDGSHGGSPAGPRAPGRGRAAGPHTPGSALPAAWREKLRYVRCDTDQSQPRATRGGHDSKRGGLVAIPTGGHLSESRAAGPVGPERLALVTRALATVSLWVCLCPDQVSPVLVTALAVPVLG